MEKNHRFANQSMSKGQTSDSKKNQDNSIKWPRNSKRREQSTLSGFKPESNRNIGRGPTSGKTRNQTNFNYDKRPRHRPETNDSSPSVSEASALETSDQYEDDDEGTRLAPVKGSGLSTVRHELHSVFSPGSKKQSLNHLLNFHYTPRERDQPIRFSKTGNHRSYVKKIAYNKEQYLQANCQFVVRAGEDYTSILATPDTLVDWAKIEQVHNFSSENPQCPICLYPPVAAKMTKCGHIFCWPCILHYLALSDKAWRKCPICYDAIHVPDLRSCVLKPYHSYAIGEVVTFQLMQREKSSMKVDYISEFKNKCYEIPVFNANLDNNILTKLLLAGTQEIYAILDREERELENQIVVDGVDCPENIFVQQALEQLKFRRENVLSSKLISASSLPQFAYMTDQLLEKSSKPLTEEYIEANDASALDLLTQIGFVIDEENNFTLNDVDIIPTMSCASSNHYFFYQCMDGQPLFLNSLNTRMLQAMYGSLDKSPMKITGKIVHKDSSSMTHDLRKRLKYLQHLPICTQFEVVEIEFEPGIISNNVLDQFNGEVKQRQKDRQKRARAERIRERQIFEFNERQLGKSLARSANINIGSTKHFPSCGSNKLCDFSQEPTLASSLTIASSSALSRPGPSWSKMLSTSPAASRWPSLPSGESINVFEPLAVPKQSMIQVTGPKMKTSTNLNNHCFDTESDYEENFDTDEGRTSEPRESLVFNIDKTLEQISLNCDGMLSREEERKQKNVAANNYGAKRKKNKKTLLFSLKQI